MAPFWKRLFRKRNKINSAFKKDLENLSGQIREEIFQVNNLIQARFEELSATVQAVQRSSLRTRDAEAEYVIEKFAALPLSHEIRKPQLVSHSTWAPYLSENFNKPGVRILEIGSRKVTGAVYRNIFNMASYVGFDYYEGENVDLVGDAHKLSSYFSPEEKFDLIFSSAVFEHLCMPWVVAQEINRLLNVGGCVFVETHFSFSSHERPWNFFQFSDMGLRALFSDALGFELVDSGMSNPINGVFTKDADQYLQAKPIPELYCHSEILCRKIRHVSSLDWSKIEIDKIADNSRYPVPTKLKLGPVGFEC